MIPLPNIEQSNNYFCGPASLASLLSHYGIEKTQEEIAILCESNAEDGTDPEGLKKCIKDLCLIPVEKIGGTWEELVELIKNNTPIIIGWYSDFIEPGDEHYSVVIDITDSLITVMDPEIGDKRIMQKDDFLKRWATTEPFNWYLYVNRYKSLSKDTIINATIEDLPQILDVAKRLPDHFVPAAHKEIEEDFRDDSVTKIIYRKNDKVVGFIIYKIGNDLNGELLWLGVDPDHRGQSIGNKLMKFLLNDMKNKKVNEINISVVASTVDFEPFRRTRKFYEQFGFMETRIDKDYYGTEVDRSIMSLKP